MRKSRYAVVLALVLVTLPAMAQETPASIAEAYESLADTILAVRAAEADFVKAMLDGHLKGAAILAERGDWQGAAAHMALFANEGDNAIAGVRKRLLEGGHHFNAAGEEAGIFEEGYVVVTREAKAKILEQVSALRQATDDDGRMAAWKAAAGVAKELLGAD